MSSINRHENGADEEEGIKGALLFEKLWNWRLFSLGFDHVYSLTNGHLDFIVTLTLILILSCSRNPYEAVELQGDW